MAKRNHEMLFILSILSAAFFVFLSGFVGVSAAPSSQQEVQQKLADVQARIQELQRKRDKDLGEVGKIGRKLRETEKVIGQIDRRLDSNAAALKSGRERLSDLEAREKQMLEELSRHHGVLRTQARSEYLYSGQEKLRLLLNQQDPAMVSRMLVYYDYLRRARIREIERAREVLQSISQVQGEILEQQELTRQIQSDSLREKEKLQQEQGKRKSVLASLRASASAKEAKLAYLEKDEKQLKGLLESLQGIPTSVPGAGRQEKFHKFKGKLFWPVVGKPSNRFGQRRSDVSGRLNWRGVFIPSNEGNNVRSIFDGLVVFAEWLRGFGLLIIVSHDDGYMSLYGHNQSLYKRPGERVTAGERIATVGNSGGNTRSGLYFEIRKQGKPVNPGIWCAKPARVPPSG